MMRKVYVVQPSFRTSDGSVLKGWSQLNMSPEVLMLSASVPASWDKSVCLEFYEDIDFDTDAPVVLLASPSNDIAHARRIADRLQSEGKVVIFGGFKDEFTIEIMKAATDAIYYGIPGPAGMERMLEDALDGALQREYRFDLDVDFPFDYSMFRGRDVRYLQVLSSLGCKYRCRHCCHPVVYRGRYSLRDLDLVLGDIAQASEITKYIAFRDANLYNNRDHLLELCRKLEAASLGITWGAQVPILIGRDPIALQAMYRAGCRILFIGLESLNQDNLRAIRKPFGVETFAPNIKAIQDQGIQVTAYFVLGLEHDTPAVFDQVYEFVQQTRVALPLLNVYIPIPGTELFERLSEEGALDFTGAEDFLEKDPFYGMPNSTTFFTPKRISRSELEAGYVDLTRRLSTYPQILRRVLRVRGLSELLKVGALNLDQRRESTRLQREFARRGEREWHRPARSLRQTRVAK